MRNTQLLEDLDAMDVEPAPPRRRSSFRLLALALVVALAGVGLLFLRGTVSEDSPAADNRALTDTDAGTKAVGDVSNALTRVFTYGPDDTVTAERAAAESLTGRAAADYRRLFGQVKQQAVAQRLALKTHVVRAGLISLTGGRAQLLVFLDQVATRAGKPTGSPAAAQLSVTAELKDGLWRITELKAR
jgi:Mce-associated membrane protein